MRRVKNDVFIIIPAKPLDQSKTRLAGVLTLNERISLTRHLLLRTLHLARQAGEVVVVSRGAAVRRLAKQAGAWALVEAGFELNAALRQASAWVAAQGGKAILVVPGDLPRLELSDLQEIIRLGESSPKVVIAPCHRRDGTNALLLRPPGLIEFAFGPGSFARHQQAARGVGVEPVIYHSPAVAFDLDVPGDLETLAPFDQPVCLL